MTVSYSNPLIYGPQKEINDLQDTRTKSTVGETFIAGAALGGAGGLTAGIIKNPYISKKGEATDTFTKNVYKKYAETTTSEEYKTTYNQHK
jgi:hypothetical protein